MTTTIGAPIGTGERDEVQLVSAGTFCTIQDAGRPGYAHVGVGTAGAVDLRSFALANRLAGNEPGSPMLELTMGGLSARVTHSRWASLTGACCRVTLDGTPVFDSSLFWVRAGALIEIGTPSTGLRSYLAFAGGLRVEPVLGSASYDTLSHIGPPPVRDGQRIRLGAATPPGRGAELVSCRIPNDHAEVRFRWGPREALFSLHDRATFAQAPWTVTPECNRVGVRLDGPPLTTGRGGLPSEGTMIGSIQVPPSGLPIVFLSDRPVTGGYPIIATVVERDLGLVAQARPGTSFTFVAVSL